MYIPDEGDLHKEIVKSCHDTPTAGHPGKNATTELVTRHYWWPRVTTFIVRYVAECDWRQRYKPAIHCVNKLIPNNIQEGLWQVVGVDLITGLPECKGLCCSRLRLFDQPCVMIGVDRSKCRIEAAFPGERWVPFRVQKNIYVLHED